MCRDNNVRRTSPKGRALAKRRNSASFSVLRAVQVITGPSPTHEITLFTRNQDQNENVNLGHRN